MASIDAAADARRPDPATPVRRFTPVAGTRVHSLHVGRGAAVVLLHGLAGSHRWWQATVPALAADFAVHVPELVGFGASGRPRRLPNLAAAADTVASWMEALGLPRSHVVGHSMGGQIAMHLAARHPARVRRLVLVAAAGVPRPISVREAWRLASEVVPPRAWGRPRFLPTIARDAARAGPRVLAVALTHILRDDVVPLLPRITAPTLVVWGAHDPLVPLEHGRTIAAGIPDARLVVLADAAHNPMIDRPAEFNAAVRGFLEAG